ncbi:MAG: hypothetical protein KAI43_05405 [Candidatus Aureabacteria bacterium]|nr:hypothetical protein [Candidatus Auribacterota bacterium]
MKNVVFIHNDKNILQSLKDISENIFQIIEISLTEDIKEFVSIADLFILHAPSLRQKIVPVIEKILAVSPDSFISVLVKESKPDFSYSLIDLGVKDVIQLNTPQKLIKKRLLNLLDLKIISKQQKEHLYQHPQASYNTFQIIEAVKSLHLLIDASSDRQKHSSDFLEFIKNILGVSNICFIREDGNVYKIKSSIGFSEKVCNKIEFLPSEGIMAFLFSNRSLLRKDLNSTDPSYKQAKINMKSLGLTAFSPVIDNGSLIGAIGVNNKISGMDFTENDYSLLLALTNSFAKTFNKNKMSVEKNKKIETSSSISEQENIAKDIPHEKKDINMDFVRTLAMRSSHELKNALVSIKTFTQLLPKKYKNESFRKDFFNVVGKEVDHLNSLVEDLLFFSHPVTLYKEKKDFLEIIKKVSSEISKEYKNISIKHLHEKELSSFVLIDEKNISIALHNIFKNSVQAMKGKGTISISLKKDESAALYFSIKDEGPGITEDIRKKMFEPFFTTKIKGLGLGLTISKKIIEAHGWKLISDNSENDSIIHINIPSDKSKNSTKEEQNIVFDRFKDRLLEHNH